MRFPSDTLGNDIPPVDPTEVGPGAAVGPVRRIGDGNRGVSVQTGGPAAPEEEPGRAFQERIEEDRRKMCRRIYHIPVLLDTRSGEERRKANRRLGDPLTHIAKTI